MNKKSRIFLISAIALLAFSVGGCTSCNEGDTETGGNSDISVEELPDNDVNGITLSKNSLSMFVGDYQTLTAVYAYADGAVLSWESDNTAVATVNSAGVVEGISEGKANVTVKYGGLSAVCEVQVDFGDTVPEMVMPIDGEEEFAIALNGEYTFVPTIIFRNRSFDDGKYEIKVSQPSVLALNGKTITGIAKGTSEVMISASWRGFDESVTQTLQTSFTVRVVDDVSVCVDGLSSDGLELYSAASFEGNAFENTVPFAPVVLINGQQKTDAVVQVIPSAANVVYDQTNAVLVGQRYGNCTVDVKYEHEGVTFVKQYAVQVKRPDAQFTRSISFFESATGMYRDAADGFKTKTLAEFVFGNNDTVIVDAWTDETSLTVDNNKILGVTGINSGTYQKTVSIGTETGIYHIDMTVYGKYIYNKEDLGVFVRSLSAFELDCYVELARNIDATGYSPIGHFDDVENKEKSGYWPTYEKKKGATRGFMGTLNGNGYRISNLTVKEVGLFCSAYGATVKNIAFLNATIEGTSLFGYNVDNCTFENVYIDVASMGANTAKLIAGNYILNGLFKNVYVQMPDNEVLGEDGIIGSAFLTVYGLEENLPTFENVIVVSKLPLGLQTIPKTHVQVAIAENDSAEEVAAFANHLWDYGKMPDSYKTDFVNKYGGTATDGYTILSANGKVKTLKGVNRYATVEELFADTTGLEILKSYPTEYFHIKDGVFSWGTNPIQVDNGEIGLDVGEVIGNVVQGMDSLLVKANAGETVTLNALTCKGYKFVGWKNQETGEMLAKDEGANTYSFIHDGESKVFVAIWEVDDKVITTPII